MTRLTVSRQYLGGNDGWHRRRSCVGRSRLETGGGAHRSSLYLCLPGADEPCSTIKSKSGRYHWQLLPPWQRITLNKEVHRDVRGPGRSKDAPLAGRSGTAGLSRGIICVVEVRFITHRCLIS